MEELLDRLMTELRVNARQARGGLVALLRAGKQNMRRTDFDQFLNDIPGADDLLREAPPPSTLSSLAGGLGTMLGGQRSPGRWAGLAASFTELGIDLETAKGFRPIVVDYVKHHGGEELVDKLQTALKI